ncbi:MAG TPA: MerR family transcriptional regulator [Terriglobales bacterium]|nr:MerR family transcriptional regulator [Terriglobales bacterium]
MQRTFTSGEVVALTGISPRQLQWWDEQGIVVPARAGHKRIYSLDDVAEVAVLCELRHRGFSLQKIRRVIRFLQKELGKRLVETVRGASEYHLLTDGRHIYLEDTARGVVDLLKNARQPMLSVCLSDTVQRLLAPMEGKGGGPGAVISLRRERRKSLLRRKPTRAGLPETGKRDGSVGHPSERRGKAS